MYHDWRRLVNDFKIFRDCLLSDSLARSGPGVFSREWHEGDITTETQLNAEVPFWRDAHLTQRLN